MEDARIIDLYWQRAERAIEETDRKYGKYCMTVADNILHDREDDEECVSDTWLRAWNSMPPQRPSVLRAFLARITRNLSLDRWRARQASRRGGGEVTVLLDELEECLAGTHRVEESVEASELAGCIGRFVAGLPEREGDVFTRRYFFAETIPEIAERYGLTANNVTVILSRTRNRLKQELVKEGYLQ